MVLAPGDEEGVEETAVVTALSGKEGDIMGEDLG